MKPTERTLIELEAAAVTTALRERLDAEVVRLAADRSRDAELTKCLALGVLDSWLAECPTERLFESAEALRKEILGRSREDVCG